jgi:predicted O-linked N-acetylglucosamine transferase (SPINDLY family)
MKPGRNDPCPCGSGKKYKRCCQFKEAQSQHAPPTIDSTVDRPSLAKTANPPVQATPSAAMVQKIVSLFAAAQYAELEKSANEILKRYPDWAPGWRALGAALKLQGKDGIAAMRRAVELAPHDAEGYNNLGTALNDASKPEEAFFYLNKAVTLKPDYAEAHYNLGRAFKNAGQLDAALESFRKALALKPTLVEAHHETGLVLHKKGQLDAALTSHQQAIALNPNYALAHDAIGVLWLAKGKLLLAQASIQRALELDPNLPEANNNMGHILEHLSRIPEAISYYRKALHFQPENALFYSNLLFCLSNNAALLADAETLFVEHRRFGEQFETPLRPNWPQHTNSRDPGRCLKVGFVSGDFRNHAVARVIGSILENLAHCPQLSLHAYYNHSTEDNFTQLLKSYFKYWNPISGLSDAALAEQIRNDSIDILIDLSGHTGHNRLLTFARKPAPIQASWIGYPCTTGFTAMDYYLVDRNILPPGNFDHLFTEKLVYLPASSPFIPYTNLPEVNPLPALSNGHLTFGSFNRPNKINPAVIKLWAKVLHALPNSRMLLGGRLSESGYAKLVNWFAQEHISPDRLEFLPDCDTHSYLKQHQRVDICLDTFPYTGSITTCDGLCMGVPTLTLAGNTFTSRLSAGVLSQVKLEAFIAHHPDHFVQLALAWADNLTTLAQLRMVLREKLIHSPMGQPAFIAACVERALRAMWENWCQGLPAQSFEVTLT